MAVKTLAAVLGLALAGCATTQELQTQAQQQPSHWLCVASVSDAAPDKRAVWRAEVDRRGETCERFATEMTIEANRVAAKRAEYQRILSAPPAYPVGSPFVNPFVQPRQAAQAPAIAPQRMQAIWTGRSYMGKSVTGGSGMVCEYNYAGNTFTRMFASHCPSSVDVQ